MAKVDVLVAQFPYGDRTHVAVSDWVTRLALSCQKDERVGRLRLWRRAGTPVTVARNGCLEDAEAWGADFVLMLDSDMEPDLPRPGMVPFWEAAFGFALRHDGPCVVGAPYCDGPPNERPHLFRWRNAESGSLNPNFRLDPYTREEAAAARGLVRVAALPTGVLLVDMRAVRLLGRPRFYYQYQLDGPPCPCCGLPRPGPQAALAGSEDVTFSRDLSFAGVPLYAACDSWAGHHKDKLVGPPECLPEGSVPDWISRRVARAAAPALPTLREMAAAAHPPHNGCAQPAAAASP